MTGGASSAVSPSDAKPPLVSATLVLGEDVPMSAAKLRQNCQSAPMLPVMPARPRSLPTRLGEPSIVTGS